MKKSYLCSLFLLSLFSCNQQSQTKGNDNQDALEEQSSPSYKIVKVLVKGGESVEMLEAENDSIAFTTFMEKGMKEMFEDQGKTFKKQFLINPQGDTLNSDKNLSKMMKYIMNK